MLLQPTEIEEAGSLIVNYIVMDDQRSTSLIKGIACGTLSPGVSILKKLYLTNLGAPGDRVIVISVQSQSRSPPSASAPTSPAPTSPTSPTSPIPAEPASPSAPPIVDRTETLRTISVSAVAPLTMAYSAVYKRPTRALPGLSDLRTYENAERPRDEADAVEVEVTSTLTVTAPAGIVIETVVLQRKVGVHAEVADCSIDQEDFAGGACAACFFVLGSAC